MKVTLRVSPFAPVQEVVEFARGCEAAGFDGIGFLDSQMINRDVFVTLGLVGAATSRIGIATAVTNPVTRHVSVIASSAATVDDVAPGRVQVWLGRGFSAVNLVGLADARTRALGEATRDLRRLLAGEWDVFTGSHSRMRTGGRHVPIYIAAAGPRTIRLAGEVADGLLLAGSLAGNALERARGLVADGAKSAGRDADDIEICMSLLTSIRPTREEALRWAGPLIALRLGDKAWLETAGIDTKGIGIPAGLSGLYPDPMHAEDHDAAMDAAETIPLELRLEIASKLGLIGTPQDAIDKLKALHALDVRSIYMRSVDTVSFPQPEVDAFREHIGPTVRAFT